MAKFPIRYSEKEPPAVGPSVRANLDVRTGGVEAGEQLARAGGRLAQFGLGLAEKIGVAEDTMALSTLERQSAERWNAAIQAAQGTQDPEAEEKIFTTALEEIAALGEGQRPQVTTQFALSNNRRAPLRQAQAHGVVRQTRMDRLGAQMEIEDQADYADGSPEAEARFMKRQYAGEKLGTLLPEVATWKRANFGISSTLKQVAEQVLANDGQVEEAVARLEAMPTETMNEEQLADRAKWLRAGAQQRKANANAMISDVITTLDASRDKPLAEKIAMEPEIRQRVLAADVSNEEKRVMLNWVDKWVEGEDVKTDPVAWSDLNRQVRGVDQDTPLETITKLRQAILDNAGVSLSVSHTQDLLTKLEDRMEKSVADAINYVVKRGEQEGANPIILHKTLSDEVRAGNIPRNDIIPQGMRIMAQMPKERKGVFTEAKIQETLGVLELSDFDVEPGELAAGMVNYLLGGIPGFRGGGLGPSWRQISPEAEETFKRKNRLGSWHFQSEEEKADTVEYIRSLPDPGWTTWPFGEWGVDVLEGVITEEDRAAILKIAPLGEEITPEHIQEVENYLVGTDKVFPEPTGPSASAVAATFSAMSDEELAARYRLEQDEEVKGVIFTEIQLRKSGAP